MLTFALEAPWYTFTKKVNALFEADDEICVGDVYETENGNYAFDIIVGTRDKYLALDRMLPRVKHFGGVDLEINLADATEIEDDTMSIFKAIFQGNRIVKDFKGVTDQAGVVHNYLRFWPEVIQFYDDDLTDYNGNWSGLAQDIAREVFEHPHGMNFCTAPVNENDDAVPEEPVDTEPVEISE